MYNLFYHKDLTVALKFLFPKASKVGLPALNPHGNSIYHKFRQWCKLGIFEKNKA